MKPFLKIMVWFALCFWPLAVWGAEGMYVIAYSSFEVYGRNGIERLESWAIVEGTTMQKAADCFDAESCQDMAFALNEAHERRNQINVKKSPVGTLPCPCGPNNTGQKNCVCGADNPYLNGCTEEESPGCTERYLKSVNK